MAVSTLKIDFGDQCVRYHRSGQSKIGMAGILGSESLPDGRQRVWLDRLIHRAGDQIEGWAAWGVVSTVLDSVSVPQALI